MTRIEIKRLAGDLGGQNKLAEMVGLTEAAVSRWISGERKPSGSSLKLLAQIRSNLVIYGGRA